MIDIHTHIIPYVDDGSTNISTSVIMIKKAIEQGVTDIICTPHYMRGVYGRDKNVIVANFLKLKETVKELNLPINIYLGQEIKYNKDVKDKLLDDKLLYINDTRYILLEFSLSNKIDISDVIYSYQLYNINPIVAHIERYDYITIDDIREIKLHNGLIQINATSIIGKEGFKKKRFVNKLIKEGLVDFIGSDIHEDRQYRIKDAYKYVCKKHGTDKADKLFKLNALMLIKENPQEEVA